MPVNELPQAHLIVVMNLEVLLCPLKMVVSKNRIASKGLLNPILVHLEEVSIKNLGGIPSPEGADNSFGILENHELLHGRIALE